jgi:two-component system chemotaxis sensor kinase CheA
MDHRGIFRLLTTPGFSTKDEVSDLSGRGVGMDVVKTNIEKLGGTLSIDSIIGESTTITIKLPLTLAIINAQIVEAAGNRFAIPQVNISEMVIAGTDGKTRIENVGGHQILHLRGELLPLINLEELLLSGGHEMAKARTIGSIRKHEVGYNPPTQKNNRILVLNSGNGEFGLIVSDFLDSEEIVIKPLSDYIKQCRYYSGATILGDGRVAVIIDVVGLAETARLNFQHVRSHKPNYIDQSDPDPTNSKAQYLMFGSHGGETFALPLALVSRIDKLKRTDLINIDGRQFVNFKNRLQRLIRLDEYLQVSPADNRGEDFYAIIPDVVPYPIGITAGIMRDVIDTAVDINSRDHAEKGILGSAIINRQATLFLDIFELFEMAAPELYTDHIVSKRYDWPGVLVIEKNALDAVILKKYLAELGIDPIIVPNPHDALREIRKGKIKLSLISLKSPPKTITSLIGQARELPGGGDLSFFGLIEYHGERNRDESLKDKLEDIVIKFDKYALSARLIEWRKNSKSRIQ